MDNDIQEPQTPQDPAPETDIPEQLEEQAAVAVVDDREELAAEESAVMTQINLESLINRYLKDIQTTQEKLKAQKSMLDDTFNNDADYAQAQQKVKEATKAKKGIKERIQKQDTVVRLNEEVNSLREELTDQREGLSQYLQQYQAQTGFSQFTTESGEILEIITVRKLVRRNPGKY